MWGGAVFCFRDRQLTAAPYLTLLLLQPALSSNGWRFERSSAEELKCGAGLVRPSGHARHNKNISSGKGRMLGSFHGHDAISLQINAGSCLPPLDEFACQESSQADRCWGDSSTRRFTGKAQVCRIAVRAKWDGSPVAHEWAQQKPHLRPRSVGTD